MLAVLLSLVFLIPGCLLVISELKNQKNLVVHLNLWPVLFWRFLVLQLDWVLAVVQCWN